MSKKDQLEARQRKWMEERRVAETSSTPPEVIYRSTIDNRNSSKLNTTAPSRSEDDLVEKIASKLSQSIKDEIRKEMRGSLHNAGAREVLGEQMDGFLRAELHTHTCKICEDLMIGPDQTPMILFPCGHSFCSRCVRSARKGLNLCPLCKQSIESAAVNQSLQILIEQFVKQKSDIMTGQVALLDEAFGPSEHASRRERESVRSRERTKFSSQLQSLKMRYEILTGQLSETETSERELHSRRDSLHGALSHFEKEAEEIEQRLRDILEEKELVQRYLKEQHDKISDVDRLVTDVRDRRGALQSTLLGLEVEMEKLSVICAGMK